MQGAVRAARTSSVREPRARARLRLIIGMHLLDRLAEDPDFAGRRLPSIRAVAAASGTHRNTVAAAYSDLARLGLVTCEPGSGSFASLPHARMAHAIFRRPMCHEPEMARLLSDEAGIRCVAVPSGREAPSADALLLQPLDLVPPNGTLSYPLAPRGRTLSAVRWLPRGSTAFIVSRSPAILRLMRRAVRALHGTSIGIVSLHPAATSKSQIVPRHGHAASVVFHDPGCPPVGYGRTHEPMRFLPPDFPSFRTSEPPTCPVRNG